ncbi:hypothetical protein [Enhygromyxa salina]|uniref:Uncharacterized protein n=1 Tax=Enhygromyxa salina TaxID=215803 RepID=A0A2S9XQV6_9BACT|nr:hypothetical protein [Enhygromyxa salina]PRP95244.1 hypothetical protein ENSA7_75580 [Enhygromyxa salina]
MRLLVLAGAGLAIPDAVITSIELGADQATPWLADLLYGQTTARTTDQPRRTLRLQGGGAVDVPATMHFVEHVTPLALSDLLRLDPRLVGIVGVVELPEGLSLICDPSELVGHGEPVQ